MVETDKLKYAKEMIARIEARDKTLLLPVDHVVTTSLKDASKARVTKTIGEDEYAVDIGPQTIRNYSAALKEAGTIFWNGPMGIFELPNSLRELLAWPKLSRKAKASRSSGAETPLQPRKRLVMLSDDPYLHRRWR